MHPNTLRKVYAALVEQGYATTRHGSGTVAHVQDAAGAATVREIADVGARERSHGRSAIRSWSRSPSLPVAARRPAHAPRAARRGPAKAQAPPAARKAAARGARAPARRRSCRPTSCAARTSAW